MNHYDQLKQAVRDGHTPTVLFVLAWLEGSLGVLDQVHATDHMDTVQRAVGEAFNYLDAHPEALA